ncbi:hypothetical protein [Lentiprolixibacter aurantiacus]|uniref:DUF4890 domain-containing protein n=1 Tax=Lentiprolixibacter aurantiacus TaxID=2993939 RepID=A0AAE3SNB9_9FLAO|nr:hypothetical protein [Lentiprolixibacter aurantiacus]MCX2719459.1 hypothetical protein [Lentiprolixibacter aurantiacus]
MKYNGIILIGLFILLLGISNLNAQTMGNRFGRQRNMAPAGPVQQQEPKALTAPEIVEQEMPKITEALNLNEFEQAVVSSILTKYVQQRIELQLLKLEPNKMRESIEKIQKNQEEELKAGLPEDKFLAFQELQKNRFQVKRKDKKKRKKKKNNKNNSDSEI